jgi:hypothetical protein
MDTTESSAPHAHPSTEDHDDTVEAHYTGLERLYPHACIGGWVSVGYIDEDASLTCWLVRDPSDVCPQGMPLRSWRAP